MPGRSIDGVFVPPHQQHHQPKLAPVAKAESSVPHTAKAKPLPHLAPYIPNVQYPPVTYLRPTHGEPRPPVVVDGTVKHSPDAPGMAATPAHRVKELVRTPTQPFALDTPSDESAASMVFLPSPPESKPNPAHPAATPKLPSEGTTSAPSPKNLPVKKRRGIKRALDIAQYPVLAAIALLAAQSTAVGQWFVLAYAVYAFVRRVPSQASFGMALFLLVSIPVFQLLHQPGIAQNTAVYVYELLVVGTLQAIIELYISRHKKLPQA